MAERWAVVMTFAFAAVILGLVFIWASAPPRTVKTRFTIPAGALYYAHYQFSTASGGTVAVSFSVDNGSVVQYVMEEAQFQAYITEQPSKYLAMGYGVNGSFNATLPSAGTYEIMSLHGPGNRGDVQNGTHTMTINALNPAPLYVGGSGLVTGLALTVAGVRLWSRPDREPAEHAHPYVPPPLAGARPSDATGLPGPGGPPAAAAYGTIVVTVENHGPQEESVQVLVNGAPAVSLAVAAGGASQAAIRQALLSAWGSTVRVDALTPRGEKTGQDVAVTPGAPVPVTLRIG